MTIISSKTKYIGGYLGKFELALKLEPVLSSCQKYPFTYNPKNLFQ